MPRIACEYVDVWIHRGPPDRPEFLLLRRAEEPAGLWLPVMGKVEPGETAVGAARRETREETGFDALDLHQIDGVHTFYLARTDTVQLTPVFAARISSDTPTLSAEHDAFRWVAYPQVLDEIVWPGQRPCVEQVVIDAIRSSAITRLLRIHDGL